MLRLLLTLLFAGLLAAQDGPRGAAADVAPSSLRIEVLRGRGIVHMTGSRISMPIAVEVTDEAGTPVEGAAVSLRLPSAGPSGTFSSGLTTDIVITGKDGRAVASGVRWNGAPGTVDVRLAARKGRARAAAILALQLSNDDPHGESGPNYYSHRNRFKTVLIVVGAAAGSVVTGLAFARK